MRTISVLCGIVFLLSLAAWPALGYAGGRACTPLAFPGLWPAELTASAIGLLAVVVLVIVVIGSLLVRRRRAWTIGTLAVVIAAGAGFWFCPPSVLWFLDGLRDRFVAEVGYSKMREFAREVAQTGIEVASAGGSIAGSASPGQQKQWDDLVARYPFLGWNDGAGSVIVRDGVVQFTWGSALAGHWGFEVALGGTVRDVERDQGVALKVSDDIQFIYID